MKVVLVDNLVMPEEGAVSLLDVHPHLGLLALAAAAEADGHRVEIYDPKREIRQGRLAYDESLYEGAAARILQASPDAVGFTTLGCSLLFVVNVAGVLRRGNRDLPILLGGPHATMLHRELLARFPQFDVVVRYEADETFASVLKNLERRLFDLIPGVSWRRSSRHDGLGFTEGKPKVENLDRLPLYSYDHYPVEDLGLSLLRIEAGRGCPFACTFCSTAGFFQRSFRLKTAERLVRELDALHGRYGYTEFKLDHDMFTVNRSKVAEFCEAVRGRGYRWRVSARVDCVDRELLRLMADAGCAGLYFGIETGSERMQRISQKRLELGMVEPMLEAAREFGMETTASFITGYPEETEADRDETLDMMGRATRPGRLTQLHLLMPEPGTPLFAQRSGELRYDGYRGRFNANIFGEGDERLIAEHAELFSTYYYYPGEVAREEQIFVVETVDVLRRAGPVALRYTLRAYGGRLSRLAREIRQFGRTRGWEGQPEASLVAAYFEEKFGRTHHITALFRYALAGEETADVTGEETGAFDRRKVYRVGADVHIFQELRDCALILNRIRETGEGDGLIDDGEFGEPGVFLTRTGGGGALCARLDAGTEAIVGLFAEPRSCEEVMTMIEEAAGVAPEAGFFEELVNAGILAEAERVAAR